MVNLWWAERLGRHDRLSLMLKSMLIGALLGATRMQVTKIAQTVFEPEGSAS